MENSNQQPENTKLNKNDIKNLLIGLIGIIAVIYFISNIFNFDDSAQGAVAIRDAKSILSQKFGTISESEIDISVSDEKDGKYILKCKTSNKELKETYGKTFYIGYSRNLGNGYTYTYNYSIDKSKSVVKDEINW